MRQAKGCDAQREHFHGFKNPVGPSRLKQMFSRRQQDRNKLKQLAPPPQMDLFG